MSRVVLIGTSIHIPSCWSYFRIELPSKIFRLVPLCIVFTTSIIRFYKVNINIINNNLSIALVKGAEPKNISVRILMNKYHMGSVCAW